MTPLRPMADYDLTDPASYASPSLEADLVMKGGITSGLVYPLAASRLATRYSFRSVGGASAGAIAAGLSAAAEYRRRHPGPGADPGTGFAELTTIPQVLGTKLATLFVPSGRLKRAYQAITTWLEPDWGVAKKLATTLALIVAGAPAVFAGVTIALLIPGLLVALALLGWPSDAAGWGKSLTSLLVWLPGALLIGLLAATVRLLLVTLERLPQNGYGFCRGVMDAGRVKEDPSSGSGIVASGSGIVGRTTLRQAQGSSGSGIVGRTTLRQAQGSSEPGIVGRTTLPQAQGSSDSGIAVAGGGQAHREDQPLTEWLTDWLDKVAGLPAAEGPLTFGHLYGEAASAAFRQLRLDEADAPASPLVRRAFDPELDLQMMTACLSFKRPYVFPFRTKVFHFCPECWKSYFPTRVLTALVAKSSPPTPKTQKVDGVSVPIDQTCRHHPGTSVLMLPPAPDIPVVIGVRLSLSFPVLLSAIPFQTVDFNRADGKRGLVEVWFSDGGISSNFPIHFFDSLLPRRPTFGINLADEHPDFPDQLVFRPTSNRSGILPRAKSITSVIGFVAAILDTMHNWVDNMAVPAPGFRDRVVDLRTKAGEGGLNLKMKPETITALGERGDQAALLLEDFDFDNHRWIRYRTTMGSLTETLDRMHVSYPTYREFITDWSGRSYQFDSAAARASDRGGTQALMDTVAGWEAAGYPATDGELPDPRPQLRPMMRQ